MEENKWEPKEHISHSLCKCSICLQSGDQASNQSKNRIRGQSIHCLFGFLQLLPRNFPLPIISTAFPKQKVFFLNKFVNRLTMVPYTKITDHFPLSINVLLFYPKTSCIAHKYEMMKEDNSYIYVQGYNSRIPFSIHYDHNETSFMDRVLQEKLPVLIKDMKADQHFSLSQVNREFLIWVHKEYHDSIYCHYFTRIICQFLEIEKKVKIISGDFEWIIEKAGCIRLSNVKHLVIENCKTILTFQQQYEEKIMEKLNGPTEIKLLNGVIGQGKINNRVVNFRNEIRSMFKQQKMKILEKTEKERTIETKTQSDEVAKLFLPQLYNYKNLREVLNDEAKFKKVVLGIDQSPKKKCFPKRLGEPLQKRCSTLMSKHARSKTQH